jgi:hypothetical protein
MADDDSIVSRSRESLADSGPRAIPIDEATGRPRMVPMDMSQMREGVMYMPRYLSVDKDSQALGSRIIGTKKLDKNTALQGHYDFDTTNDKFGGLKNRRGGAGVTLMHSYAKGGKVTASTRADGIAARGKTKGRIL